MTECLEQEKARLFIRYLKERGIYIPFSKNHIAFHGGHCPMFNRIASVKDLLFSNGIIDAGCSFSWNNSNEGVNFWCKEDDAIHHYAGFNNSLDYLKIRLKIFFEDATLIRKKKF